MPTYSSDWVTPHEKEWRSLIAEMAGSPICMIEIGAWEGRSAAWWLDNLLTHPRSRLTSIDPHLNPERYAVFLSNMGSHPDVHKMNSIRGESRRTLANLPDQKYDMIYVDGSHEGRDVILDGCLAYHKLKPGGILLFDDYEWEGMQGHPRDILPKAAIDAFLELYEHKIEIVHRGYQLAVRRVS